MSFGEYDILEDQIHPTQQKYLDTRLPELSSAQFPDYNKDENTDAKYYICWVGYRSGLIVRAAFTHFIQPEKNKRKYLWGGVSCKVLVRLRERFPSFDVTRPIIIGEQDLIAVHVCAEITHKELMASTDGRRDFGFATKKGAKRPTRTKKKGDPEECGIFLISYRSGHSVYAPFVDLLPPRKENTDIRWETVSADILLRLREQFPEIDGYSPLVCPMYLGQGEDIECIYQWDWIDLDDFIERTGGDEIPKGKYLSKHASRV